MKICGKNDCQNIAIHKGKYCTVHRTNKKKIVDKEDVKKAIIDKEDKEDVKKVIIDKEENRILFEDICNLPKEYKNIDYDMDRLLMQEQDEEYKLTMDKDIERIILKNEEKDIKEAIELSKKLYIDAKKNKIKKEPEKSVDVYNLHFKLPNNIRLKRYFHRDSTIDDIRNFLDIYFYDNNLQIENYELITFPKIIFKKEDNKKLYEYNLEKSILFYIYNLDS